MSSDRETSPLMGVTVHRGSRSPNGVSYGSSDRHGNTPTSASLLVRSMSENEGITLSWSNVNVFTSSPSRRCNPFCCRKEAGAESKQILQNVSGVVKPGTLLAILGASGAGKTTLLNVLNQRNIRKLTVEGDLRVNGVKLGRQITAISGYVQQDDLFIGRLTVQEHLWFQAMLKMERHVKESERLRRIEDVMQELGLTKCANTQIGVPGKYVGISGGERKRLAFACEVLTNPALLFCDEPTSGLDSFMAENVVNTLRSLASRGKTVICTIHQPSSQVYALFDRVLLMAEGRVAFMGATSEISGFFSSLGNDCPPSFNPADYYIHALAVLPGREEESRTEIQAICNAYEKSLEFDEIQEELEKLSKSSNDPDINVQLLPDRSPYRTSCWVQFWVLLWRAFTSIRREPILTRSKIIQTIFVAVIFGLVYVNQSYDQKGVMNINGALFLFQSQVSFSTVFPVINTFASEYQIFLREHHNGMYKTGLYFISKIIAELPIYIIIPILFNSIGYWMIGLYEEPVTFLIATGTLLLVCNCAVSYGYLLSCVSSNLNVILALAPALLVPMMLFGGLFLNAGSIPVYLIWFRYISWFSYSNEILVVNQWKNVHNITCDVPHGNFTLSSGSEFEGRCFRDGNDVIKSLSYEEGNVWLDFVLLGTLLVGFRLVAFIIFYFRSRRRD